MNIIFALGHPAHYHLFKNISNILKHKGHDTHFVITPKDVLIQLLESNNEDFSILAYRKKNENLFGKLKKIINSTISLNKIAKEKKANLLVGCLSQIAYSGIMLGIPSIFVGEDDFSYTWMQGIITYPFVNSILAPTQTKIGPFKYKRIAYNGYQKLAYLHPNYFNYDNKPIPKEDKKKILIRLVNLYAYHDASAIGLNNNVLKDFIDHFNNTSDIKISAERELPKGFEKYRLVIPPEQIHEVLYHSDLFIGDSQSMAVEASILGVPNIRINNFSGKISVLNELEFKYGLTKSLNPKDSYKIIEIADNLINNPKQKEKIKKKRNLMINEKIDVTAFMVWFIENYPVSKRIMKETPDYQYKFI